MAVVATLIEAEPQMRYLRVSLGGETGEPGMTLYEVDSVGWVHRQVQVHHGGCRFAPEDILMCRPLDAEAMLNHPATDEIEVVDFELLWGELEDERNFARRVPDRDLAWEGIVEHAGETFVLRWMPDPDFEPGRDWTVVPGFVSLFVHGDEVAARAACAAVFLEHPVGWGALLRAA